MNLSHLSIKTARHYLRSEPVRMIFFLLWVAAAIKIIMAGNTPNPMVLEPSQQEGYNFGLVISLLVVMCLHGGALLALDVYIKSYWKFVCMFIVTTLPLFFFGLMLIHAPEALLWLILWLVASFLAFFFICFGLACLLLLDLILKK